MLRLEISQVLKGDLIGTEVWVGGWVRTRRDSKAGISFVEINDGSSQRNLQLVIPSQLPNYQQVLRLYPGASILAYGKIVESPGRKQWVELHVSKLEVLGPSEPESYPLQKKRHSFEFLRTIPHLRPRTNTFGAVARLRSKVSFAIHRFFQLRGFHYIHTPIITGSDCEGAGELFKVTTLDPLSQDTKDFSDDFFSKPAYLTVSGQLEVEAYALALGKVYTFGPTFRAERSYTPRHLAEFWMVEPEAAFMDLEGDIALATDLIRDICRSALEECPEEMDFFDQWIKEGIKKDLESLMESRFEIITYTEAIKVLQDSKEPFEYPVKWGVNLQAEHEKYLSSTYVKGPLIVIDYPKDIKPFYMKLNPDGKTVRAMDMLLPGIGEIIGGSQREDQLDTLVFRMQEKGIDPNDYWWYLDLRRFGTTPHSGFGLGLERMLLFLTGLGNIKDVIPYPRTPGNLII